MTAVKTFETWMDSVDAWCWRLKDLSVYDLSDNCFADWYADGMTAQAAARRALKNERCE